MLSAEDKQFVDPASGFSADRVELTEKRAQNPEPPRRDSDGTRAAHGATVSDARILAKRAKRVFIFYRSGPRDWDNHCIGLSRIAFLLAIRHKQDDQAMPCRLSDDGERHLLIGCGAA